MSPNVFATKQGFLTNPLNLIKITIASASAISIAAPSDSINKLPVLPSAAFGGAYRF